VNILMGSGLYRGGGEQLRARRLELFFLFILFFIPFLLNIFISFISSFFLIFHSILSAGRNLVC